MIDLHTHSNCSDGTLSPKGLIDFAISSNITHLAITDHDTVDCVEEALEYSKGKKIKFAYGVEISAELKGKTLHILGYKVDYKDEELKAKLKILKDGRDKRNPQILKKLNEEGIEITMEEIIEEANGGIVGRPHFAKVMLKKGFVSSIEEAFEVYLKKGAKCYVERFRYEPEEAIQMVLKSGGIPVFAHPLSTQLSFEELEEKIVKFKDFGLLGLECFYRNHTEEDELRLLEIAKRYDLLVTGGSDFHGSNRPNIMIGKGEGRMNIPLWVGEKFFEVYEGNRK